MCLFFPVSKAEPVIYNKSQRFLFRVSTHFRGWEIKVLFTRAQGYCRLLSNNAQASLNFSEGASGLRSSDTSHILWPVSCNRGGSGVTLQKIRSTALVIRVSSTKAATYIYFSINFLIISIISWFIVSVCKTKESHLLKLVQIILFFSIMKINHLFKPRSSWAWKQNKLIVVLFWSVRKQSEQIWKKNNIQYMIVFKLKVYL